MKIRKNAQWLLALLLFSMGERPFAQNASGGGTMHPGNPVSESMNSLMGIHPLQQQYVVNHKSQTMNTEQTEQNKAIIRSLYEEILNLRKFDRLQHIISEAFIGVDGAKGPEGFAGNALSVINAFPDMQWTIDDLLAADDKVVVRWRWEGTHTAPFRGIPASHKKVIDNAIVIYQLKEGKVIQAWLQTNRLGVLMQIGLIPEGLVPGARNGRG